MMRMRGPRTRSSGTGLGVRLIMALVIAAFAFISYLGSSEYNPVTGETQYVSLTEEQEIALGLQSAPTMIQEYGGLFPDQDVQDAIDELGFSLVENSFARNTPWRFEFHVLNDDSTINAFALPGGQIFITSGLLRRLESEGQVAGVLGHEIGHVLARHSAQRLAKSNLSNGLLDAVIVATEGAGAGTAQVIAQLVNMSYGREDELESDLLGVCIMDAAGYDPSALIGVMRILAEAGGGGGQPEFFSTHPNPENRVQVIENTIRNIDEVCPQS